MRRLVWIVLSSLVLTGCSLRADQSAVTAKIARFHALLNAGNFAQIRQEVDPAFQWPARGPSFEAYLGAVHRKLGFCGSWRMARFVETVTNKGRVSQANTRLHCDSDDAEESFLFTGGKDPKLRGYVISSRLLVTS